MVALPKLLPKPSEFTVTFHDGKTRKLKLRPYTLRDEAYLQENFDSIELSKKLNKLDVRLISQLVWRQLEPESRKIFDNVKVIDDSGNEVQIEDYEKLMESFGGLDQIVFAFNSLLKARGLNALLEEETIRSSKKKSLKKLILQLFSIN